MLGCGCDAVELYCIILSDASPFVLMRVDSLILIKHSYQGDTLRVLYYKIILGLCHIEMAEFEPPNRDDWIAIVHEMNLPLTYFMNNM